MHGGNLRHVRIVALLLLGLAVALVVPAVAGRSDVGNGQSHTKADEQELPDGPTREVILRFRSDFALPTDEEAIRAAEADPHPLALSLAGVPLTASEYESVKRQMTNANSLGPALQFLRNNGESFGRHRLLNNGDLEVRYVGDALDPQLAQTFQSLLPAEMAVHFVSSEFSYNQAQRWLEALQAASDAEGNDSVFTRLERAGLRIVQFGPNDASNSFEIGILELTDEGTREAAEIWQRFASPDLPPLEVVRFVPGELFRVEDSRFNSPGPMKAGLTVDPVNCTTNLSVIHGSSIKQMTAGH